MEDEVAGQYGYFLVPGGSSDGRTRARAARGDATDTTIDKVFGSQIGCRSAKTATELPFEHQRHSYIVWT